MRCFPSMVPLKKEPIWMAHSTQICSMLQWRNSRGGKKKLKRSAGQRSRRGSDLTAKHASLGVDEEADEKMGAQSIEDSRNETPVLSEESGYSRGNQSKSRSGSDSSASHSSSRACDVAEQKCGGPKSRSRLGSSAPRGAGAESSEWKVSGDEDSDANGEETNDSDIDESQRAATSPNRANTAGNHARSSLPLFSEKRKVADVIADPFFAGNDRLAEVMSKVSKCKIAVPAIFRSIANVDSETEILSAKKHELQLKLQQQKEFHMWLEQANANLAKQYAIEQEMARLWFQRAIKSGNDVRKWRAFLWIRKSKLRS